MDVNLIENLKKSESAYQQARSLESPLQLMPGLFSSEDLAQLSSWKDEAYAVQENLRHRQGKNGVGPSDVMAWPTPELSQTLSEFLKSKIKFLDCADVEIDFAFHKNYHAYGLHTDAGYDESEVIYKQGIIPLEIQPASAKTHTVIMKQRCYFSSSFPALRQYPDDVRDQVNPMKEKWLREFEFKRGFSEDMLAKYWQADEFHREWLSGFEIDHAFEWKIGDTVVWDRSQIHCSSDLSKFGVEFKLGLMWVSRKLAP